MQVSSIRSLGSATRAPLPVVSGTHHRAMHIRAAARAGPGEPSPQQASADSLDVSATVVPTAFRVSMNSSDDDEVRTTLRVLFVSESGVCRAPLAAAAFTAAAARRGLGAAVEASAAACRDYNVGDEVDPAAVDAAAARGWSLPEDNGAPYTARLFTPATDLASQDLILVMDKVRDTKSQVSCFEAP